MADKDFLPKLTDAITPKQARELNPLVLAYVGDSVQMLYVRTRCALTVGSKAGTLHKMVSSEVKAEAQAKTLDGIMPELTEEEQDVYRRARNSHTNNIAKNATVADYKKASGLEAVIGYLYLSGQHDRLLALLTAKHD